MSGREIYVRMELRSHICRDCLRALMGFECAWQGGGTIISEPLGEVKSKFVGFSPQRKRVASQSQLEPNLLVALSESGFWALQSKSNSEQR